MENFKGKRQGNNVRYCCNYKCCYDGQWPLASHYFKHWASTLITATTSVNLPKPVSTDLTITSDSVLTSPMGKYGVWGIFIMKQSLDGWATFSPSGKTGPAGHETSISMSQFNN